MVVIVGRTMKQAGVRDRRRGWGTVGAFLLIMAGALVVPSRESAQGAPELAEGTRALYQGQFAKAAQVASGYLRTHPQDATAYTLLARAEISEGQYEAAYEALRTALKLAPFNGDALYYLERLCNLLSKRELQRLLETSPDSPRSHQIRAEAYLARNDKQAAGREYEAALQANPTSVEILDALGDLRRDEYQFDSALGYYARARQLSPRDYASAYGTGSCYLFQHETKRAIESLKRAVEIDPESAAAHLALGDALLRDDDTKAAINELNAALEIKPELRQAYTLLALAYRKLGMEPEAQQALAKDRELAREEASGAEAQTLEESRTPAQPE